MDLLNALILVDSHTHPAIVSNAFNAPGWKMKICTQQDSLLDYELDQFDWIIVVEMYHSQTNQEYYILKEAMNTGRLKKNVGLLHLYCVDIEPNVQQHVAFLNNFAQCLYSAYYAPESIPAPPQEIYAHYVFSGLLQFQTPTFARMAALALGNLSKEPDRLNLGLWELFINGIEHGNLGINHEEKRNFVESNNMDNLIQERLALAENFTKFVRVSFAIQPDFAKIHIQDDGVGFDWKKYWEIDHARMFDKSGRGIALARMSGFDLMEYLGCGNCVSCQLMFLAES